MKTLFVSEFGLFFCRTIFEPINQLLTIFLSGYFNKLYKNIIIIQKTFKTQIQQLSGGTLNFENSYNKKICGTKFYYN